MNKQNRLKWVTYGLNMLLGLPFAGLISSNIFSIVYGKFFQHSDPPLWAQIIFPVLLTVIFMILWGLYQYKNIILASPLTGREKLKNATMLGVMILVILSLSVALAILSVNFVMMGRKFTDYEADGASGLSEKYIPKALRSSFFPHDTEDIRITGRSGSAYYAWWTCNCSEQAFLNFAKGNGFELKNEMISVEDWERDGLLSKHIEEAQKQNGGKAPDFLSYQKLQPNGGGYSFLYIKNTNILFGRYANR